jgi:NitT/TauT family transport system permease protein
MRQVTGFTIPGIIVDIAYSWIRMIVALVLSIIFSLVVGILAARNKRAESIVIPMLDVFQSIPILGFFPVVVLGIIAVIPGVMGINLAVIVLIFTSMSWNITFGVYEAVKSIPQDYLDLSKITNTGSLYRITSIYIPASLSRIAYNAQISWAVGLFYLVSSEILSLGVGACNPQCSVSSGIGVAIMNFYLNGDYTGYIYAIMSLIIAVIVWQYAFLRPFALWSERYKFVEEPRAVTRDPLMKFYSWINHRSISKLFLLTQGRGVSRFTSSITRFRRGLKYSFIILVLIFIGLELSALVSIGSSLSNLPSISGIASVEGNVIVALGYSFVRVWYVYFICIAIGVPLAITVALNSKIYSSATPVLEIAASIPAPVLLPLLASYFRNSPEFVAAVIIFLGTIWYIIFNVMAGIRSLPAELWELPKEFRVSKLNTWRNLYLPAAVTAFVTGSITAIGAAWNTLIVAEYFSVQQANGTIQLLTQVGVGIGKTIQLSTNPYNPLTLTLAVLSMTVLIVGFNLTVWRRIYHYTTRKYSYNR